MPSSAWIFGRGVRDPGGSLLHIRLQLLAGGSAVALEIFVHCSCVLSLLGYFLCHLLQECHNSLDGIHLVPHLHRTNSSQRQIDKGKKQKCRTCQSRVPLYPLTTASFVHTRNLSLKWRKGQNNELHNEDHNTDRTQFSPLSSTPRKCHQH